MIEVIAGIICNPQNEILIALRPAHVILPGVWEFPGGKIEKNETAYQALVRELEEEIDILVTAATPFISITHAYPDRTVNLHVWQVTEFQRTPHGKEGQIIRWVTRDVLPTLEFPEGNKAIIAALCNDITL